MNNIATMINNPPVGSTPGIASQNTPIKNRPKVKDELKSLLKLNQPLNNVPCGN